MSFLWKPDNDLDKTWRYSCNGKTPPMHNTAESRRDSLHVQTEIEAISRIETQGGPNLGVCGLR